MGVKTMHHWKLFEQAVDRYVKPRTSPVALKMLKSEADIPKSAQRPLKDLGHRVALCQGFAYARRNGITLAMLREDQYCPLGVIVLGLVEPHKFWLEGNTNLQRYTKTSEAAAVFSGNAKPLQSATGPLHLGRVSRAGVGQELPERSGRLGSLASGETDAGQGIPCARKTGIVADRPLKVVEGHGGVGIHEPKDPQVAQALRMGGIDGEGRLPVLLRQGNITLLTAHLS